jgi:predicted amidohydrolase YtcJ
MRVRKIQGALLASALTLTVVMGCGGSDSDDATDIVLRGGKVVTMDSERTIAQAIAVRDGRIVFVGSDASVERHIGKSTRVVELGGRMLMPGFIDAHLHALAGGRSLLLCDLAYEPLTRQQLTVKLQACLDGTLEKEPDVWLRVVNWDRQSTASLDGDPTRQLLDGLKTKRPIAVTSSDYHAVLANSRAFALAGIDASTPDPVGGRFLRDANGAPSGICVDAAGDQLNAAIPPDSEEELLKQGRAALASMREQGITSFMDARVGPLTLRVFKKLRDLGELTARTALAIHLDPELANEDPAAAIAAAKSLADTAGSAEVVASPGVRARVVKVFMDGVVNAPADNAALLTPYYTNASAENAPHWVEGTNLGELYHSREQLQPLMLAAVDAGFDMHLHAIGDRAVRTVLDAVQGMRQARPGADFRPAIAHAETVDVADYPRFAALDTTATLSFQWAQRASYNIGDTENHLGPERFERMEPSGSLRQAGARLAHGSDWPIDPFDTFLALKVGVTRSGDPTNPHSGASTSPLYQGRLNAEPGLSRDEMLAAITVNAAHQLRLERHVGSLEIGKLADLIVLERDFLVAAEDELGRNRVLMTMVGGKVVWSLDPFSGLMSAPQRALNARDQRLNAWGSTGHAVMPRAPGSPSGDGHRH